MIHISRLNKPAATYEEFSSLFVLQHENGNQHSHCHVIQSPTLNHDPEQA